MATNLALDDALVEEAKRLGHHRSKKEAVNAALSTYVQRIKQRHIVDLFGKMDYDEDYHYKKGRSR